MEDYLWFVEPLSVHNLYAAMDPVNFNSNSEEALEAFKNLKVLRDGTVISVKKSAVAHLLKTNPTTDLEKDIFQTRMGWRPEPHKRTEKFRIKNAEDLYSLLAYYIEI